MKPKIDPPAGKIILDACCGSRMFWIQKKNPNTLYIDIREEPAGYVGHPDNPNHCIEPDMVLDYRDLPFKDGSFIHIAWDPPHEITKDGMKRLAGINVRKYGALRAETWQADLKAGFKELWRVLAEGGTMNFKFSDRSVKFKDVLRLFPVEALYGTLITRTDRVQSRFFPFVKIPKELRGPCNKD